MHIAIAGEMGTLEKFRNESFAQETSLEFAKCSVSV